MVMRSSPHVPSTFPSLLTRDVHQRLVPGAWCPNPIMPLKPMSSGDRFPSERRLKTGVGSGPDRSRVVRSSYPVSGCDGLGTYGASKGTLILQVRKRHEKTNVSDW